MALEERPISSEQMYRIEDNGHSIFGMKKLLMMENAGHGLADFILSEKGPRLDGKKIISFCGTGNNGGDAMVASRHLSGYYGVDVTIVTSRRFQEYKDRRNDGQLVNSWKDEINKNTNRNKCSRIGKKGNIKFKYNY